ncbi:MAG: SPOR domain-containing protein [Gemmatimonadota bacterium]|nr:SPOR domain-containing protein [Gemmatimonadota bacterium]
MRAPRNGGFLSAYRYPGLDSVLWRSSQRTPSLARVIAFDPDAGYLAGADAGGRAVRIDLRLGAVSVTGGDAPIEVRSVDGDAIYAQLANGDVTRFTTSGGDWKFKPKFPVATLFPQHDGSLVLGGMLGKRVFLWKIRPPGTEMVDSISFDVKGSPQELVATLAMTAVTSGERIFFAANETVLSVRSRDLGKALEVSMGDPVTALTSTPSGDRLFVALKGAEQLRVIDRFEQSVVGKVKLPAEARGLRMDPLGRVVLVRGPADTVWVVSVASDKILGTLRSEWREDLPLVLPDGQIAVAQGANVIVVNSETFATARTITNGARDFWHVLRWNGFRPRSAGLDEPVRFRSGSSVVDSAHSPEQKSLPDTTANTGVVVAPRPRDSTAVRKDTGAPKLFTVQFAAVLTEKLARDAASLVKVDGMTPRISTSTRAGKTIYRVTLGPYLSRGEADRIGKASAQPYWIFEGTP